MSDTTLPSRAEEAPAAGGFALYNSESVYDAYVQRLGGDQCEAQLIVSGIHCAGCVRSIEQGLQAAGVLEAQVNFGNHRAAVRWDDRSLKLGDLLATLHRLGYEGHPYDPATQETLHRRQVRRSMLRLGVAGFGAGNVMMYSVGLYAGHFYGIEADFEQLFRWLSALLAVPVVFYSGWPFLQGAWGGLRNRRFNMDSLISLGVLITMAYSLVALLAFPGSETYFDSAVMIVFFLLIGRALEAMARSRAGSVTEGLMGLQVKMATRLEADGERTVPIEAVVPGDRLLVRPGDAVPTDGTVLEGESELDESALTGEARPRAVQAGDALLGGTLNVEAPLVIEAQRVGADTVLARICTLVEQAQSRKPPLQRLADRIASYFVSVILLLAAGTFAWWEWLAPGAAPQSAWITAIAVLIIACPCALGLATPVAVLAGSALAARRGILVKGGEVLERAAHVTDVVLDKTGTLTEGGLAVTGVQALAGIPAEDWLPLAAALERRTVHPIADALQAWLERSGAAAAATTGATAQEVRVLPGRGALGRVDGRAVAVGNARLLAEQAIALPPAQALTPPAASDSVVYVAVDGLVLGRVTLNDPLRPDAAAAVEALRGMGLAVHLFSGDRPEAVAAAARRAGIADARGGMLPDEKLAAVSELQSQGRVVAMVGDGVNDAPALIQADLAIAVSSGSDLTLEAAQVLLMRPRLLGAVETIAIARRTLRAIRENLALSLGYNAIAVPLAMAGLVIPLFAAVAMSASSLLVVSNALRLRLYRGPLGEPAPAAVPAPRDAAAQPTG
jgi:Cu2+-exporting ATPase